MISVELFAGCGGLALGLANAGFKHVAVVETDEAAIATLRENQRRGVAHYRDWEIRHCDIRAVDFRSIGEEIDLVSGGPPCQPFSIGGKHLGPDDPRNMWPQAIRAVSELRPKAFLFENVRGLLRPAFSAYVNYLVEALSRPDIEIHKDETWICHLRRLQACARPRRVRPLYQIQFRPINAADYGAPQVRHRSVIMGVRSDIAQQWSPPLPTHSESALLRQQSLSAAYWARHGLEAAPLTHEQRPSPSDRELRERQDTLAWRTVRDVIGDLPDPEKHPDGIAGHVLHPGAKSYARHTGSSWDRPAKALKAGDHGVPGGENMLTCTDGRVRYFTIREMARLQGFPDDFQVPGTWKAPTKQLGNAVPIAVGKAFGDAISSLIKAAKATPQICQF